MVVRSLEIARGSTTALGTVTVVFTVPAGKTLLLKEWAFTNTQALGSNVSTSIRRATVDAFIDQQAIPGFGFYRQTGHFIVGEPGDELVVFDGAADVTGYIFFGALLEGVA